METGAIQTASSAKSLRRLPEMNVQTTNLCYLATIAIFVTSQVLAETAPAPAQGPGPLAKRIPCDAFTKQADGSWRPTRDVNIELPDGNVLTVGSAASSRREFRSVASILGLSWIGNATQAKRICHAQ